MATERIVDAVHDGRLQSTTRTMQEVPQHVMECYSPHHLMSLLVSNDHAVDLTEDGCERLLQIMDEYDSSVFIANNWDSMARDNLGSSGDSPNYYAIGNVDWDVSSDRQAYLLKDAYAVQQEWLDRGDGRLTKAKQIDVSDTKYVDEKGVCWFPKQYMFVVTPTEECYE